MLITSPALLRAKRWQPLFYNRLVDMLGFTLVSKDLQPEDHYRRLHSKEASFREIPLTDISILLGSPIALSAIPATYVTKRECWNYLNAAILDNFPSESLLVYAHTSLFLQDLIYFSRVSPDRIKILADITSTDLWAYIARLISLQKTHAHFRCYPPTITAHQATLNLFFAGEFK